MENAFVTKVFDCFSTFCAFYFVFVVTGKWRHLLRYTLNYPTRIKTFYRFSIVATQNRYYSLHIITNTLYTLSQSDENIRKKKEITKINTL